MTTISAALVKELREATGVGMMDCKKALSETNGDFEAAVKWLREKGLAAASKKADRDTNQGSIFTAVSGSGAAIVEFNCETDFVGSNDQFGEFGAALAQAILANAAVKSVGDLEQLQVGGQGFKEWLSGAVLKLGENLTVKKFEKWGPQGAVGEYVHSNGKIGVIVGFSGAVDAGLARDIAMQIAASSPSCVDRKSANADEVLKETDIIRNQLRNEGKPEAILDKIVEGKLSRFYQDICLLEQSFIKDQDKKVQDLLPSGVTVNQFVRYALG